MLSRSFTRREKILMLFLSVVLLIGLYFLLVEQPIRKAHARIADRKAEVTTQIETSTIMLAEYNRMKAELEEILATPPEKLSALPPYDNFRPLMAYFNRIFAGTEPDLSFDPVVNTDGVICRTVRFRFTAPSYQKARAVLTELTGTGFRCLLDSLDMAPAEGNIKNNALSVAGTITFYEQAQ